MGMMIRESCFVIKVQIIECPSFADLTISWKIFYFIQTVQLSKNLHYTEQLICLVLRTICMYCQIQLFGYLHASIAVILMYKINDKIDYLSACLFQAVSAANLQRGQKLTLKHRKCGCIK